MLSSLILPRLLGDFCTVLYFHQDSVTCGSYLMAQTLAMDMVQKVFEILHDLLLK